MILSTNPATEQVLGKVPVEGPDEISAAWLRASDAFATWSQKSLTERAELLGKAFSSLKDHKPELAELCSKETGKILALTERELEDCSNLALNFSLTFAQEALSAESYSDSKKTSHVSYHGRGIVAGITPWNAPIPLTLILITHALMAGNCLIIKPSELAPLISQKIAKIFNEHLPLGVLQVIQGKGNTAQVLLEKPFSAVAFWGSDQTAVKIQEKVAGHLITVSFELGGKDALIIGKGCDLDRLAAISVQSIINNSGQNCFTYERIFIPNSCKKEFITLLQKQIGQIKIGGPLDPMIQMGPLASEEQLQRISYILDEARSSGCWVWGGHRLERAGYFIRPAIVSDPDQSLELVRKETFGPILTVFGYDDTKELIAKVNDCDYGLGACVWHPDREQALAIAHKLDVGMIGINGPADGVRGTGFFGQKRSSLGSFGAKESYRQFAQKRKITIAHDGA